MTGTGRQYRHLSSAQSSVGQVRENNEDSIRLWAEDSQVLGVVADGMGGAAAGEEASRLAVQAIERGVPLPGQADDALIAALTDKAIADALTAAIRAGNLDILELARRTPNMRGMGTTVTAAYVRGNHCIVAHVGDSRAYLVEAYPAGIEQITSDHSFVEALVAAGHLTPDQAAEHPMKNVLYRALGQSDHVDVDLYELHLSPGDQLVLCSDGLTRHVSTPEIGEAAHASNDPQVVGGNLINLANSRGGEDNVSVIVIRIEAADQAGDADADVVRLPNPQAEETLTLKSRGLLDDLITPPAPPDTPEDDAPAG
ncbi:MAG: Stp1/IreP family PP2C-type Ser/Thr phosphatase [Anaerolineae bacterium]|nr:Stp1/IreP family PP2C-type Ser/Thr phosphatase [Anaerolineae bacterium]